MSTLRRRSQRRTMVGSDGGDQGGSVSAGAVVLILKRLRRRLSRVYRRSKSGKYDWGDWHSAATAQVEAELLREHPEWWRRYVRQAQTSKHSWRVLQLLVADLVEESWPKLIIDPVQEHRLGEKCRFSPLFGWIVGVAVGKIRAPTKRGYDPAERVWRNLEIYLAVSDLKAVGLSEPIAQKLVAEKVGLTKTRVGQICLKHEKVHRRVHRKK